MREKCSMNAFTHTIRRATRQSRTQLNWSEVMLFPQLLWYVPVDQRGKYQFFFFCDLLSFVVRSDDFWSTKHSNVGFNYVMQPHPKTTIFFSFNFRFFFLLLLTFSRRNYWSCSSHFWEINGLFAHSAKATERFDCKFNANAINIAIWR